MKLCIATTYPKDGVYNEYYFLDTEPVFLLQATINEGPHTAFRGPAVKGLTEGEASVVYTYLSMPSVNASFAILIDPAQLPVSIRKHPEAKALLRVKSWRMADVSAGFVAAMRLEAKKSSQPKPVQPRPLRPERRKPAPRQQQPRNWRRNTALCALLAFAIVAVALLFHWKIL